MTAEREAAKSAAESPEEAVTAAENIVDTWWPTEIFDEGRARAIATAVLEAASPAIRADERDRLARLAQDREGLGELVRRIWVDWAAGQPEPKPSWLVEWDGLDDGQREVDMRIGEGVAAAERARIVALLRKVDQWYEFDWVLKHLTGKGPEPVTDSFGMLPLPAEVQQEIEAGS